MQQPYVLVVESEPDLSRRIVDALREARYEIASEAEITWARRSMRARKPDAVVIDTALFDGSGFALAKDLRANPSTSGIPLLFIARRHRGATHRAEALRRFGALEYLQAPLDVHKLMVTLLENVPPAPVASKPSAHDAETRKVNVDDVVPVDEGAKREARDVERNAKDLAQDAELKGTLKRTAFARLLQRLYARRAHGQLLLLRGTTKKIVQFAEGYPVSVRSNVLGECLGQILLGRKLITNAQLTESLKRMKAEKKQQGTVLVEMGALSPHNLTNALKEQMAAKLYDMFAWRDGQFSFVEATAPTKADAGPRMLDRSTASLILEGIRRHYDAARQNAVLEDYVGKFVALSPDPVMRLQEITSDPIELSFIYGIDGGSRLEAVLDGASIPRDKAKLLLVALSEAQMIEPAAAAQRRVTELRRLPKVQPGETDADLRARLAGRLDALLAQNHFEALGLAADASREDIENAYDRLAREHHADKFRSKPDDIRRIAQEIFERLREAYDLLRDPAKRRAYAGKLGGTPLVERDPGAGSESTAVGPNPAAHQMYKLGVECLRQRRYQEAVEAFRQAARLVPEYGSYRAALGWALFREAPAEPRASRAAVNELRRAIQIDPTNHKAHVYLGHVYAQTGRSELAIDEFETVMKLKPGAADVAEELRRLRGGP